ncbi:Tetracycline resistance protein, class C [Microbacterium oxydans]|uniref:Tetracycline resistance protein, class C n=2 Tax=Microbacterium oxydans TaxID=82380 RepID=A0A0F0LE54_9MICO|nr:MFS transporter [Microbacterium oxydans]KJL29811.1 Tetracycline resistance protein, class C [Microbacterium oxydans]
MPPAYREADTKLALHQNWYGYTFGMTSLTSSIRNANRAWIMLVVLTMLTVIGMTVVLPVLPFVVLQYVSEEKDLALWVGVLEAVNGLCAFLIAPFLGRLSDRFGRRPVIIAAAFGAAFAMALFGIGCALWVLVLARVIQGLTAGDLPALFAYLADITPPEKRAQRFGLLGALSGIGMMIGPAIGGLLASVSLQLPVFLTAAVGLTIAILSIFLLPESLKPENRITSISVRDVQPFAVFKNAFGRKELRGLMIGFGLLALPFGFFVNNFSVLALDSIQWGPTQIGLMTAAVGIIDILIQGVLLGILLPRIGERGVIVSGIVAQMVGLIGLAVVASIFAQPWLFIVGALMLAAGQGASQAAMDGAMSNAVGDDEQGWLGGATQSLNAAMGTIAPLIAGALYVAVSHSAPYWLGAALMVVAVIVVARAHIVNTAKVGSAKVTATDAPLELLDARD